MINTSTKTALIGHTGFVGSNLLRSGKYNACFNSKNIDEIRGQDFDYIVCAGAPAAKWLANKNPEQDASNIGNLTGCLNDVKCKNFVLISTIDVYSFPVEVDETHTPSLSNHAYGANRFQLEQWITQKFQNSTIIRLPGLFGPHLKKNIIFDLMNKHNLGQVPINSRLQWYPIHRLQSDIEQILNTSLRLINICPEPIETANIVGRFFPSLRGKLSDTPGASYDIRTINPGLFNFKSPPYHFPASMILDEIELFLAKS
jgi:hypothetical protein